MFGQLTKHEIVSNVNGRLIVMIYNNRLIKVNVQTWSLELAEKNNPLAGEPWWQHENEAPSVWKKTWLLNSMDNVRPNGDVEKPAN